MPWIWAWKLNMWVRPLALPLSDTQSWLINNPHSTLQHARDRDSSSALMILESLLSALDMVRENDSNFFLTHTATQHKRFGDSSPSMWLLAVAMPRTPPWFQVPSLATHNKVFLTAIDSPFCLSSLCPHSTHFISPPFPYHLLALLSGTWGLWVSGVVSGVNSGVLCPFVMVPGRGHLRHGLLPQACMAPHGWLSQTSSLSWSSDTCLVVLEARSLPCLPE